MEENKTQIRPAMVDGKLVGFNGYMGLEILEAENGHSKVKLPLKPEFFNHMGSLHGGVIYTMGDVAGGVAVRADGEDACTTMNSSIYFLSPSIGTETLYGEGEIVKHGRKTTTVDVNITDNTGKLVAKVMSTYFNLSADLKTK